MRGSLRAATALVVSLTALEAVSQPKQDLVQLAAKLNSDLPRMFNQETEWTSVTFVDNVWKMNYKLLRGRLPGSSGPRQVRFTQEAFEADIVHGSCSGELFFPDVLDAGATIRHSYYRSNGDHVTSVDVREGDVPLAVGFRG